MSDADVDHGPISSNVVGAVGNRGGRPQDAPAPWDTLADGVSSEVQELFGLMRQVGMAGIQLVQTATEKQLEEAKQVLTETRRAIYKILADGDEGKDA